MGRMSYPAGDRWSPYTSRPGTRPNASGLPGRDAFLESFSGHLREVNSGLLPTHVVVTGTRGIGKTVLLDACVEAAQRQNYAVLRLRPSGASLEVSLREQMAGLTSRAAKSFRAVGQRLSGGSINFLGIVSANVGVNERDSSQNLGVDALASALADFANKQSRKGGGVLICIDDLHDMSREDLTHLEDALHCLNERQMRSPVLAVATAHAGMKMLATKQSDAMLRFVPLSERLSLNETENILQYPIWSSGRTWTPEAVVHLHEISGGHPAYVQLLADQTWQVARQTNITKADVEVAFPRANELFVDQYLLPQWRALTVEQQGYLSVIAVHGGWSNNLAVAQGLTVEPAGAAKTCRQLEEKGLVRCDSNGKIQLFDSHLGNYALENLPRQQMECGLPSVELLRSSAPSRSNDLFVAKGNQKRAAQRAGESTPQPRRPVGPETTLQGLRTTPGMDVGKVTVNSPPAQRPFNRPPRPDTGGRKRGR